MTTEDWMRRLEEQKRAIVAKVSGWPSELQDARPADGGWSALQVLDHLVRTESGICGVVAESLAQPQRMRLRDRAGFVFVERVFLSQRRVKAPDKVARLIEPGAAPELGEIEQRWEAARAELDRLAERIHEGRCRGGVFRHPVSGWMDFERVLRFFSAHIVHHRYQLERIRAGARH